MINAPLDGLLSRLEGKRKRAKDATSAVRRAIYFQVGKNILLLTTCRIRGEDMTTTEFIRHASRHDRSTPLETVENGFSLLFRIENDFPF